MTFAYLLANEGTNVRIQLKDNIVFNQLLHIKNPIKYGFLLIATSVAEFDL